MPKMATNPLSFLKYTLWTKSEEWIWIKSSVTLGPGRNNFIVDEALINSSALPIRFLSLFYYPTPTIPSNTQRPKTWTPKADVTECKPRNQSPNTKARKSKAETCYPTLKEKKHFSSYFYINEALVFFSVKWGLHYILSSVTNAHYDTVEWRREHIVTKPFTSSRIKFKVFR